MRDQTQWQSYWTQPHQRGKEPLTICNQESCNQDISGHLRCNQEITERTHTVAIKLDAAALLSKQSLMVDLTLTLRGLQSWQTIICNCWLRSFSRDGCLQKIFSPGRRSFSPGRGSFSPGREVSHLAGEVARWILSQGQSEMNWPDASTIVWPASTVLPIAITDPARPPPVAVVYTCGLQSPTSATKHTVGTSWPLTIDQLKQASVISLHASLLLLALVRMWTTLKIISHHLTAIAILISEQIWTRMLFRKTTTPSFLRR